MEIYQKIRKYTVSRIVSGLFNRVRLYADGIGSLFPKIIYGNNAGMINNFIPLVELKKNRRKFNRSSINLEQEPFFSDADRLNTNGYIIVKLEKNRDLSNLIREKLDKAIKDDSYSFSSSSGATRYLIDPLLIIPELKELLSDKINKILLSYYQCAFRIESVRVWRNFHVPNVDPDKDDRFSNTFHNDNYAVTGLRIFVLLCDNVTRETGAFRFHDKINSSKLIRSLGYFHRYKMPEKMRKKLLDPAQLKYFEGDFGDIAVCNTQECLHAASIPKFGSYRDMLQFEIYPTDYEYFNEKDLFETIPTDSQLLSMM